MKRIRFEPWVDRIRSLTAEDEARVHRYLAEAPERVVEFFDIRYEDGEVQSFGSLKALIRAERLR